MTSMTTKAAIKDGIEINGIYKRDGLPTWHVKVVTYHLLSRTVYFKRLTHDMKDTRINGNLTLVKFNNMYTNVRYDHLIHHLPEDLFTL